MSSFLTLVVAASLATATLTPIALAQNSADEANRSIVRRAFEAWAAGTGSPYDLLADNASWTITGNSAASKTYPSRRAFISEVIQPFGSRMSVGLKPTIKMMYADKGTVIVHFDAEGTARDGKAYANTYAWFLDMEDGKIVRASAFFDSIAFNDLWSRVQPSQ